MGQTFFEKPILNSPYEYPKQYWELDETGQPTSPNQSPLVGTIAEAAA